MVWKTLKKLRNKPIKLLKMKNIAIILSILFLMPFCNLAQDRDMKKLFNQYKNKPGFEMKIEDPEIDIDFDGDFDLLKFLNKVENLYILNFEHKTGDKDDLASFKNKLEKLIVRKNFKSMVDISGEGRVRILMRRNDNDDTSDFLMIIEGDDEAMFFWASGE